MLKITAFCDASHDIRTKRATACSILLSDRYFHGMDTRKYYGVKTSTQAELLGLIQTVELIKELDPEAEASILCDGKVVLEEFDKVRKTNILESNHKYYDDWAKLLEISKGMNIELKHINGHQFEMNPNKLCDGMSNRVLRSMV